MVPTNHYTSRQSLFAVDNLFAIKNYMLRTVRFLVATISLAWTFGRMQDMPL